MRKLVLVIIAVLVVGGAGVYGWKLWSDHVRASRYAAWRNEIDLEGRRDDIMIALRAELKADPDLTGARELLAEALVRSGKVSDAAVELREAVRRDPGNVGARRKLGQVCIALKLVDEAIQTFEDAAVRANDADRGRVHLELAFAYEERYRGSAKEEDFRNATIAFQQARSDPSTEAEALEGFGMLLLEKGPKFDAEKSLATLRELLKRHPDYSRVEQVQKTVDFLTELEKKANGGN